MEHLLIRGRYVTSLYVAQAAEAVLHIDLNIGLKIEQRNLETELTNRGEHSEWLVTPDLGLHIDVQLNLIPVGILDVERMSNRMVTGSRDEHPGRLTSAERSAEFVVAGADFQTEVVHPDSVASSQRLSVMTNLDEEQFVMGSP